MNRMHPAGIRAARLALVSLGALAWTMPALGANANPTEPSPPAVASTPREGSPRLLQQQRHITVETILPPTGSESDGTPPESHKFHWDFRWDGWNGLRTEISSKTRLQNPTDAVRARLQLADSHPVLHLEELKMSGKLGAKLALDGAAFTTGDRFEGFDAGVEVRRARIYAKGDCLLILPVSYQLELGYIPHEFYIEESYLAFRDLRFIGQLKFGQFQAPMGLDVVASSRDISFMEPASPLQALAPGVNAGAQMGRPVFDQRATWSVGLFTDGLGTDFGDASRDYGRAIVRLTGLPLDRAQTDQTAPAHLLHLGLSANILYSGNSTVRYQSRPESHLAPHVVDTGNIPSQGAMVLGGEAAWVHGPFSVQGEFLRSFVDQSGADTLGFHGFYGSASWFFTGETRPYNREDGCFARVIPKRNFNWGGGGWGAWEITGRYSFVDLDSGDIDGGRLGMIMAGLNWYLHSHVKWRFNYGLGRVEGRDPEGRLRVFQTRVEVDL